MPFVRSKPQFFRYKSTAKGGPVFRFVLFSQSSFFLRQEARPKKFTKKTPFVPKKLLQFSENGSIIKEEKNEKRKEGFLMKKVITIGREFGSGGRELGRKLAERLGIAYYDREIITAIAEKTALSEEYVDRVLERRPTQIYPFSHSGTFYLSFDPHFHLNNSIYAEQTSIIRSMADRSPCVIVGRCADYILKDREPFRVFVYSDMPHRLARCRENAPENENLTDKELRQKILAVDRDRRKYYRFFTGQNWGDRKDYDLSINTAVGKIDDWVELISLFVEKL